MEDCSLIDLVVSAYADAAWTRSDSEVIRRDGWVEVITPSSKSGVLNSVRHSVLDESDAEQRIELQALRPFLFSRRNEPTPGSFRKSQRIRLKTDQSSRWFV